MHQNRTYVSILDFAFKTSIMTIDYTLHALVKQNLPEEGSKCLALLGL